MASEVMRAGRRCSCSRAESTVRELRGCFGSGEIIPISATFLHQTLVVIGGN